MNAVPHEFLAERARAIKPSPSMMAKSRVDQLRAQGRDIIDFTVGEPDLPTPAHIVQAGIDALNSGDIRYTASVGAKPLLEAVRAKFRHENGLDYGLDELIVGVGAKQLIFTALAATVQAGDEVIIPAPYWVSYPDMVLVNDGTPVVVACPEADGFKLTPDALERAITPRTKWLLLNTPSNPTGAMYGADELRALAQVLARHPQVWLLTDEIYEHLAYGGEGHASPAAVEPALAARTLTINGVSKAYAMATLISQSTSCVGAISQSAARVALTADQQCVRDAAALFHDRRDRIVALLNEVPGIRCPVPQGAFYVYPSVEGLLGKTTPNGRKLESDLDVVMFLLDEAGVAGLDGAAYGLSPYLRLSFATSMENIEEGCRRIRAACAGLA